jgi:hypothetical protein
MRTATIFLSIAFVFALVAFSVTSNSNFVADDVYASAPPDDEFHGNPAELIGAGKCKKCHNKKSTGRQYNVWKDSGHANAFELLASDEAKAFGKKLGIADPQKSANCLECHSTAYYFTMKRATEEIDLDEGVSCESCHGPAKSHYDAQVNKTGIRHKNPHPERVCLHCHNDRSPSWRVGRYTLPNGTAAGFDYDQAYRKIVHSGKN